MISPLLASGYQDEQNGSIACRCHLTLLLYCELHSNSFVHRNRFLCTTEGIADKTLQYLC